MPRKPRIDESLGIAKQPPGPKSVIVFVPPRGSLEFREAKTTPLPKAATLSGARLSGASGNFVLGLGSHRVGRADDTAVTIRDPQVSRYHAVLVVTGAKATVEDLKSANGTFLNTRRLQSDIVEIHSGDVLCFGSVELTVELQI
ncbi:MAG TPA: FHA domain-containing protein [Vicinamibacterales bacterium]|nr:FHA domain-containing protein [Vicinamibacterales bacterium]